MAEVETKMRTIPVSSSTGGVEREMGSIPKSCFLSTYIANGESQKSWIDSQCTRELAAYLTDDDGDINVQAPCCRKPS